MSKIKIKNSFPHLLSAAVNHDDCPEWIRNAVIGGYNELNSQINLTPKYFEYLLEVCGEPKQCELCRRAIFEGEQILHKGCRKTLAEINK